MAFTIISHGHPNVLAAHKTTIEITKEDFLNKTGDCIIGVRADKGLKDLDEKSKELLKLGRKVRVTLECNGFKEVVNARGDPRLTFESPTSVILRKSDFVCGRTLCVRADKAAADLDRGLVEELRKGARLEMRIEVL